LNQQPRLCILIVSFSTWELGKTALIGSRNPEGKLLENSAVAPFLAAPHGGITAEFKNLAGMAAL